MTLHKLDWGAKFRMTLTWSDTGLPVDLSGATAVKMRFTLEDDPTTIVEQDVAFDTDGTDGKVYYIFAVNDLSKAGNWFAQTVATFANGLWHSDIVPFEVKDNI